MKGVSVIICVYNVAPYVERCLDSLIGQDYPDIECLIVDDCGTDNSMEIIRNKLEGYSGEIEFRIISHDENRGAAAAGNTGLNAATRDYVMFLDPDDRLKPDCLPLLIERIDSYQADMLCYGYEVVYEDDDGPSERNHESHSIAQGEECEEYSPVDFCRKIVDSEFPLVMIRLYVFRRQFLEENSLRFLEGIAHEDEDFTPRAACLASRILCVDKVCYEYLQRADSITGQGKQSAMPRSLVAFEVESFLQVISSLKKFVSDTPLPEEAVQMLNLRIARLANRTINLCLQHADKKSLKKALAVLKDNRVKLVSYSRAAREREPMRSILRKHLMKKIRLLAVYLP